MRSVIATLKLTFFLLLCAITIPLLILALPFQNYKRLFCIVPTFFHRTTCFIFGVKVGIEGSPVKDAHVIYVGNHLSYIDIPAIGSVLPATFISKAEVRNWPVFGILARLSKTIFIERDKSAALKCIADINLSLKKGYSLILFPEGTSTKGVEILPFKSSIFELFLSNELKENLIVQPFTVTINKIEGRPVRHEDEHDIYAWYGDMTMLPHLWNIAKSTGVEILLNFHTPLPAVNYTNRKIFALEAQKLVAQGLDSR